MAKNKKEAPAKTEPEKKVFKQKGRQGTPDLERFFRRNINRLPMAVYNRADRNLRGIMGKNTGAAVK